MNDSTFDILFLQNHQPVTGFGNCFYANPVVAAEFAAQRGEDVVKRSFFAL
jgi:hypothetical protein